MSSSLSEQILAAVELGPPRQPPRDALQEAVRIQGRYSALLWCHGEVLGLHWLGDRPPWCAPGVGTWRWKAAGTARRFFDLLTTQPGERSERVKALLARTEVADGEDAEE